MRSLRNSKKNESTFPSPAPKQGDAVLIRAKLINVRQSDNEATVGFDSTTTAVVPLSAIEGWK